MTMGESRELDKNVPYDEEFTIIEADEYDVIKGKCHMTEVEGHLVGTQGHMMTQDALMKTQGHTPKAQNHMMETQGHVTEPQGHVTVTCDPHLKDEQELNIDSLLAMTPLFQDRDVVRIAARHLFLSKVKSQPCVKDVFFPSHGKDAYEYLVGSNWFDFETFAVLYVCQAVSKCQDPYNLYALIDGEKCDQHLNDIAQCPEWKKVGFALYTTLFPDLVKDSQTFTPFRAYLNSDRKYWARLLLDKIRDSRWLYSVIRPVITGQCSDSDYNRDINILFVKLHLLDPTLVMAAYHYLQKALPDLNLELATTNYLGGPLDWKLIKNEVETIIYKPLFPRKVRRISLEHVDVYYGVELLEFVMKEPRELELLTEQNPDNRRTTTFTDRCLVM